MTAFPKSILTILTLTKMTTDCKMIKSPFLEKKSAQRFQPSSRLKQLKQ